MKERMDGYRYPASHGPEMEGEGSMYTGCEINKGRLCIPLFEPYRKPLGDNGKLPAVMLGDKKLYSQPGPGEGQRVSEASQHIAKGN